MNVRAERESEVGGEATRARASGVNLWWPVMAAGIAIGIVVFSSIGFRLTRIYPRDPWEALVVADGFRASVGLPVYTPTEIAGGHATHMYGPLISYTLGAIFKLSGVGFVAARLLALLASLGIIAALSFIFFRKLPAIFIGAGVMMLLSLDLRCGAYFTQSRPDMLALAFALAAVILLFRGCEKQQWSNFAIGIVMICLAYLFKQTAAMFAALPIVSLLLRRGTRSRRDWTLGVAPLAAIVLLIALIRIALPTLHFYMIRVPSHWGLEYERLAGTILRFVGFSAIIPATLGMLLMVPGLLSLADAKMRWLAAGILIATPASIVTFSKGGGVSNSYLPALFPLTVLCIIVIARAWETQFNHVGIPDWRRQTFAWFLAAMMLASAFGGTNDELRSIFELRLGDEHHAEVVELVRGLHGRVVCPDDPTIPIMALGQASRSAWGEFDTVRDPHLSDALAEEIQSADWVVLVDSSWPIFELPQRLEHAGFIRTQWGDRYMGPYSLWRAPSTVPAAK